MIIADILADFPDALHIQSGGQKAVYRANSADFGDCVLKIGEVDSPASLARIEREVLLLKSIESDYFPKQYSFEFRPNNRFLILEQFIDAKPALEWMDNFVNAQQILSLTDHLIAALEIIWRRGVVHRDLKPANILIRDNRQPCIIDLGIARLVNGTSLTLTHYMMGPCTPNYAAPEQLTNRKAEIDFRTDQFSLGIVLLQLMGRGRHPFDPNFIGGNSVVENILDGRWDESILRQEAFSRFAPIIKKFLGAEPYLRFRTPEQLRSALSFL